MAQRQSRPHRREPVATHAYRRGRARGNAELRRPRHSRRDDRHDRLHRRMALDAGVAGRSAGPASGRCIPHPRGDQCEAHVLHRILPTLLHGGSATLPSRHPCGRRIPLPRSRVPFAARSARQARLRVGEVGRAHRGRQPTQVAAAPATAAVTCQQRAWCRGGSRTAPTEAGYAIQCALTRMNDTTRYASSPPFAARPTQGTGQRPAQPRRGGLEAT